MTMNVGMRERLLRVSAGAVLILAAGLGWIGVWGFTGLVPLVTGLTGYCPLYAIFRRGA